ncbi:hypothetical protein [Mucilaginibacter sp.]|uniref:beta barrel domain-containing protein n=1 Tax=Mucilaginibacter sp. TaxID=1882438 RepID=UPI002620333F|nr:hypothetical protein [Mucilaginibacter sp.]MDB5032231.1 hypothetical protein [Mucilaginibacter sp.]
MKIGDKLWLAESRRNETIVSEVEIATVGKKYFTLTNDPRKKYSIERMVLETQYNWSGRFYNTHQEYLDSTEISALYFEIKKWFDGYTCQRLNLDQLRQIKHIVTPI